MTVTVRATRPWLAPTLAALVLTACGIDQGGIDSNTPVPPTSLTAPTPLAMTGTVTDVDPLSVNGLELDATTAMVTLDATAGSVSSLAVGQVVKVVGDVSNGSARAFAIEYNENLRGPISEIDPATGELVVLGQPIVVDDAIDVPATADLASLVAGDSVEVSGFVDDSGTVLATYVAEANASDPVEIAGVASGVDLAAQEFFIGALRVDYSGAGIMNDLPAGEPEDGQVVDVEGALSNDGATLVAAAVNAPAGLPAAVLQAELVTVQDVIADSPALEARVLVTGFVAAPGDGQFRIGDAVIAYDDTTTFGAGDAADLQEGVLVQVDGVLDSGGELTATTIIVL